MASQAANPLLRGFRYMQREAHERPVIYYSLWLGIIGPVLAVVVPPAREKLFGYKPAEHIPISYPLPQRPRRPTVGYEDPVSEKSS
ncbi:N19M, NADH-ubiquinone oxidoreductase 9.5 kDa subunit [Hymenopellis radicata]|nr:N19M, NADH-ubiquinone oxidoreductase 9.5 kDa subunit [Hymenopellis radicata]